MTETNFTRKRSLRARLEVFLSTHAFSVTFLFIFLQANAILFSYGVHVELKHSQVPVFRQLIATARAFGMTLNLNSALVLLLASRTFMTWIREWQVLHLVLPLDFLFPGFHGVLGILIVVAASAHAIFHFAWIFKFNGWTPGLWGISMCVGTGLLLSVAAACTLAMAVPSLRSKHFKSVFRLHLLGAYLFFPLLVCHGMFRAEPYTYKWILLPMLVYSIDRLVLLSRTSGSIECFNDSFKLFNGGRITSVTLPKLFEFKPGQFAQLQIPEIDLSYHPFTIASAQNDDYIRFYIRATGTWTTTLRNLVQERLDSGAETSAILVRCRGPYGAPAQHVASYRNVVLIAGGVGSTPFCSIARSCDVKLKEENGALARKRTSLVLAEVEQMINEAVPLKTIEDNDIQSCQNALRFSTGLGIASGALARECDGGFGGDMTNQEHEFLHEEDYEISAAVRAYAENSLYGKASMLPDAKTESHAVTWKGEISTSWKQTMRSMVSRILLTFHSVRFSLFLVWGLLTRICLVSYAAVLGGLNLSAFSTGMFSSDILNYVDLSIAFIIGFCLLFTIVFELFFLGARRYFQNRARWIDIGFLLPVSVLSAVVNVADAWETDTGKGWGAFLHIFLILPAFFFLLAYRLYRVIGDRVLLADISNRTRSDESPLDKIESLDFIWTTPDTSSDEWLVNELLGVSNGLVGMHRFVTRESALDSCENPVVGRNFNTTFGSRPNFDEIFQNVVERADSRSKIGVLFCGPKQMATSVKCSLLKEQTKSNLRGTFLHTRGMSSDSRELQAKGCFVKFCFREENF